MIKLPANDLKYSLIIILMLFIFDVDNLSAQPECRSVLGAYFKPITEDSQLSWASEISLAPGLMSNRFIFNGMAYLGVDYFSKSMKHQIYFEGAYKYWYNSSDGPGLNGTGTGYIDFNKPEKRHFGFRELFYSYNGPVTIKTGIHSLKSTGSFLLDERVLGISVKDNWGPISINVSGATVFDDIARMQDVCGTRHLYNLVRGNKVNFVGDKMLDSNFVLAELTYTPGTKSNKSENKGGDDEFASFESSDEFTSFENTDEFSEFAAGKEEKKKARVLKLNNITIRAYEEFGEVFPNYKYFGGVNVDLELFESYNLDAELLSQAITNNNALIYRLQLTKEKFWSTGAFSMAGIKYLGITNLDDELDHFPSFSNLFVGEVMRLDMMHLPVMELSLSHRFANKVKSGIECKYVHQFEVEKTREIDLIYTTQLWKHLHLNAVGAYVSSLVMEEDNFLVRLEARFAF